MSEILDVSKVYEIREPGAMLDTIERKQAIRAFVRTMCPPNTAAEQTEFTYLLRHNHNLDSVSSTSFASYYRDNHPILSEELYESMVAACSSIDNNDKLTTSFGKEASSRFKKRGLEFPREYNSLINLFAQTYLPSDRIRQGRLRIRFENDLFSLKEGEYGDEGSCFYDSNRGAVHLMANHGFLALLVHDENDRPRSRCWLYPYDRRQNLVRDFILFNAYGLHSLRDIAASLAQHFRYANTRIRLSNKGDDCGLLYLNSGMGHFLSSTAQHDVHNSHNPMFDFDIQSSEYDTICDSCDEHADELYETADGLLCADCRDRYYIRCVHCNEFSHQDRIVYAEVQTARRTETFEFCSDTCRRNARIFLCDICEDNYVNANETPELHQNPRTICEWCAEDHPDYMTEEN